MIKKYIVMLFLILLNGLNIYSQTVDEIVQKMEKNEGFADLEKFKSLKLTGKLISQGNTIPFKLFIKLQYLRSEKTINKKVYIEAYDGKKGWYIDHGKSPEPQLMTEDMVQQFKAEKNFLVSPFKDYKKNGITLKLIGRKKIDGIDSYQIKLTQKNGRVINVYIEANQFIYYKTMIEKTENDKKYKIETYLAKHQKVNGVLIPYYVESLIDGKTVSKIILSKAEANANISNAIFKMPKK
jgi:hypothetical protein